MARRDGFDVDRLLNGRSGLTRQELLRLAGALGVSASAITLVGCGGDDEGSGGGTATAGNTGGGEPKRGGTLRTAFSDASNKESLDPALTTLNNDSVYCACI